MTRTRAARVSGRADHLCEGLVHAYAVTLPLFLLAFFVAKRLGAYPGLLCALALLWATSTVAAGAWLAVQDWRRNTMAGDGDGRPLPWRKTPPTTSATCRPGSTGPRPRTGTTSAPTGSTSKT